MFDLFNDKKKDAKEIRNALLRFIKEQLQKVEGGEGSNIKGLLLYITCAEADKHLYESALYMEEEDRFKNDEIQKIADDYAIALPPRWTLEMMFTDTLPAEAVKAKTLYAALMISTTKKPMLKEGTAYIHVLNGEAEKKAYTITSTAGKINIGRESKTQTAEGFQRENAIAFPSSSGNESNRSVSRQHAHIEWDGEVGAFYLYADEGGVPPLNKTKVRTVDGQPVKSLLTTEFGHHLKEGDQVILGESALLQFTERGSLNT